MGREPSKSAENERKASSGDPLFLVPLSVFVYLLLRSLVHHLLPPLFTDLLLLPPSFIDLLLLHLPPPSRFWKRIIARYGWLP